MKVDTTRFGVIEIDDSSIIRMQSGPLGFEEYRQYCLIQHRPDTKFRWLQSVEEPGLAFVVIDPSEFFEGYEIEVPDSDAEKLHLTREEDALVLAIVTVGENGEQISANLAGPVVINSVELLGVQIVLQDSRYSVKQPLAQAGNKGAKKETSLKAA